MHTRRILGSLLAVLALVLSTLAVTSTPAEAHKRRVAAASVTYGADQTVWGATVPTTPADADPNQVTLGAKFQTTKPGVVKGVRFYKGTGNGGTHTGKLWTAGGTLLASVTFSGETASGWQRADFATPVTIQANTTYVVGYVARQGHYSAGTNLSATNPRVSGDLKETQGVYVYSTTGFPTLNYQNSHYYADVVFSPEVVTYQCGDGVDNDADGKTDYPGDPGCSSATDGDETDPVVTPPATGFPTASSTGLPAGWTPTQTINGDHTISTAGAVVQDIRVNGNLTIAAPNVTLRRVEVVGGSVRNFQGSICQPFTIEDSLIRNNPAVTWNNDYPAVQAGSYTANNVKIEGPGEGFRVGGVSSGCGPVSISNSYAHVQCPDPSFDWHGDGIQGYGGPALTLRNTFLWIDETTCSGTASFFYPSGQGNTSVDIDGLIVKGGGYAFRLGTPGTVRDLNIVSGTWGYGPIDVNCAALSAWEAEIVTLDANGQPVRVRDQACSGIGN